MRRWIWGVLLFATFLTVGVLAVDFWHSSVEPMKISSTQEKLQTVREAVRGEAGVGERLSLADAKERLRRLLDEGALRNKALDSWGTPMKILSTRRGVAVRSAGADMVFGTADDLSELINVR